ncbi:hypothetical protein [Paraliobacillus sp. X-1268]|uniref:hypothetical protein n=1 Tax=Paraliobacillus sp. X-1268 TaxID=2213193 RepID=UPI000E3B80C8|nr:hypothetical protein [Paraliobacillus sp. X-1268]
MKKPRSEYQIIQDVINKSISEEEYFKKRTDSKDRLSIDLPEASILKKHPHIYREFLLSLSVEGRFRILLAKDLLGIVQTKLRGKYGVDNNTLAYLKGNDTRAEVLPEYTIRPIRTKWSRLLDVKSSLAIISRIPVEWLLHEKPLMDDKWNLNHFYAVDNVYLTPVSFTNYLQKFNEYVVKNKDSFTSTRPNFTFAYDIRPIVLIHDSKHIYLLASILEQGGFVIEIFGINQLMNLDIMREILKPFGKLKVGYCKTVVQNHYNIQIIPEELVNAKHYPIEFIEI